MVFRSHLKQGLYVFDIPTVASSTGVATTDVLAEIQTLKVGNIFLAYTNQWLCNILSFISSS